MKILDIPTHNADIPFSIFSPACTELEMVMMDWLGKMLSLPQEFLFRYQLF